MSDSEIFDCFMSHNSRDKPAVRALARTLRDRGISVWLDEERLRPGVPWQDLLEAGIRASKSVAVLVGASGLGPWEVEEMRGALSLAVKEKRPVIPVLLEDAPAEPDLPMFLHGRTWVDMRSVAGSSDLSALDKLIWGITGKRPDQVSVCLSGASPVQAQEPAVSIVVDFPTPQDLIKKPEFDASGRVVWQLAPSGQLYIYSVIQTDRYYCQLVQRLKFAQDGNHWSAPWNLKSLILGRPQDIGFKGTLYLYVVDEENLVKLADYYGDPQVQIHDESKISSKATKQMTIRRSPIPPED